MTVWIWQQPTWPTFYWQEDKIKYQKLTKVSKATATRHLTDLRAKGCLEKQPGDGRNTRYQVKK